MEMSYYHTPAAESLKYVTYCQQLDLHTKATPDREAVIFYEGDSSYNRATFKELQEQSWSNASRLIQNCPWLEVQDRIAVIGSNRPEVLLAELAAYRIGNTVIFPPTGLKSGQDLADTLTISGTKILFFEREYLTNEELVNLMGKSKTLKLAIGFGTCLHFHVTDRIKTWEDFFSPAQEIAKENKDIAETRFCELTADADMLAYCTSGTTGTPKPVLHSHFGQVNSMVALTKRFHYDYNTKLLVDRPMVNGGGSIFITKLLGICGCTVVVLKVSSAQNPTEPEQFIKIIQQEQITHMVLYGYMLHDFVTREDLHAQYKTLTSIKYVISCGQVVNQDHATMWRKLAPNIAMFEFYGATEINGSLVADPDCSTQGYTGTVLDNFEAKVIDDQGITVKRGETGELCFRGPTVCRGYIKQEGLKSCVDAHGWYHTDDNAFMNEKGKFKVLGRISDVIKYGTLLVYPTAIESILAEHPKVVGVQVVGVSDPRLYQEICACLVTSDPAPTEAELRDWCDVKLKVDPKTGMKLTPKYYLFLEEFPRQNTGKTSKRKLRDLAEQIVHGTK